MCGILFQQSSDRSPVNGSVIANYIRQRSRGTQGFGFAFLNSEGGVSVKRDTGEEGIIEDAVRCLSHCVMFHHRMPSSTGNTLESTHPFRVACGDSLFYVVHNGIISNDDELFKYHTDLGISYVSYEGGGKHARAEFNDSEALAWDIALTLKGGQPGLRAKGMNAFIVMEADKDNRLKLVHFAHNFSAPLKVRLDDSGILLGSETPGEAVKTDTLYTFDPKTMKVDEREFKVPGNVYVPAAVHYPKATGVESAASIAMDVVRKVGKRIADKGVSTYVYRMALGKNEAEVSGRRQYLWEAIGEATEADLSRWMSVAEGCVIELADLKEKNPTQEALENAWWWFYNECDLEMSDRAALATSEYIEGRYAGENDDDDIVMGPIIRDPRDERKSATA